MLALQMKAVKPADCNAELFANGGAEMWESWREGWEAEANLPGDEGEYPEQLAELAERLLASPPPR